MKERLFNNELHFSIWLDDVLYTDNMDSIYEKNQIRMHGISVPVLSRMNREHIKKKLLELLTPVLPFLTYADFNTYENSVAIREDVTYYDANDLQDLVNVVPPTVVFVDVSGETAVWHTLTVQEHHVRDVDLDSLLKHLVMHYLVEQTAPISYVVASREFTLQTGQEEPKRVVCCDSNVYVALYQHYQEEKAAWQRKLEKIGEKRACM